MAALQDMVSQVSNKQTNEKYAQISSQLDILKSTQESDYRKLQSCIDQKAPHTGIKQCEEALLLLQHNIAKLSLNFMQFPAQITDLTVLCQKLD